jgi:hypothetical protein
MTQTNGCTSIGVDAVEQIVVTATEQIFARDHLDNGRAGWQGERHTVAAVTHQVLHGGASTL